MNLIRLIKNIFTNNENGAYTALRRHFEPTYDHLADNGMSYRKHLVVSLKCAWYVLPIFLFLVIHSFFPNFKSDYATTKIRKFEMFYNKLKAK